MHINISPQIILLNMTEIIVAVSEELRSQDCDDRQNDEQPSQKLYIPSVNLLCWV